MIALPISANIRHRPGVVSTGTCFLVRGKAEGVKLVSCAHLATNDIQFQDLSRWPDTLQLHIWGNRSFDLPVLTVENGFRGPVFERVNSKEGVMVDLFTLNVVEAALAGPLGGVRVFDLSADAAKPKAGDRVISYGYPSVGETWPYAQPEMMEGIYHHKLADGAHEVEIGMVPGYSGGPVLDNDGKLLGMGIGQQEVLDRVIPLDVISLIAR
jgi:hypothetical protein